MILTVIMSQDNADNFEIRLDTVDAEDLTDFLALHWAHLDLPSDQLDRNVNTPATSNVHNQLMDNLVAAGNSSVHAKLCVTSNQTSRESAHYGSNSEESQVRKRARRASFDITRSAVLDPILQDYDPRASADATTCLETGNACITNSRFQNVTKSGYAGWFEDVTIDLGFDLLRRILNSEDHGVILCTTAEAQNLYSEVVKPEGHFDNPPGREMQESSLCNRSHLRRLRITSRNQSSGRRRCAEHSRPF
jgi:hypothetical protein